MNLFSRRWCDIVFEGRNKDYGAYVLRRNSDRRHIWSFVIVMSCLSAAYGIHLLIDSYRYKQFQEQEESVMVEQYQLLDAILDEEMRPEVQKPSIPIPSDPAPVVTSAEKTPVEIKPEMLQIVDNTEPEVDPYLEELLQEELQAEEKKPEDKTEEASVEDQLYTCVEEMPSFPGGEKGLMEYLGRNLRYPYSAKQKKIQNTVLCCFFIEKDGSVKQAQVLQPVNPLLDKEALRVIRALPKWIPARKHGQPIRVKYILPVSFRLK
jgi:periplasmic protein TonB